MGNAIARLDGHLMSPTTDARIYFSEGQAREEFTARIYEYTPRQLSKFSGCSTDATRRWVDGSRGPNVASLINVARCLPSIQQWMAERSNYSRAAQASSLDEVISLLRVLSERNDAEGIVALQLYAVARQIWLPAEPGKARDINPETVANAILTMRRP